MKKLWLCSIAFPPKRDPECIQTGRYYKYLKDYFEITVITGKPEVLYMPLDNSMDSLASDPIEVPIRENRYLNYLYRKLGVSLVDKPDSKYTFINEAKKRVSPLNKPDLIYSRSYPLSSTILGYELATKYNSPWILHLSDPWSWSPIHKRSGNNQRWHNEVEEKCFDKASLISLTSEATLNRYLQLYPQYESKLIITPNVYDPTEAKGVKKEKSSKLQFVYTGGLAGARSMQPFVDVLSLLDEEIKECIDFVVAGDADRRNRAILKSSEVIKYLGQLEYQDALELQKEADILLVVDNPIGKKDNAVFLPSKLLDYMIMGKEIWALTTKDSATDQFLKTIGKNRVFYYGDTHALETAFHNSVRTGLLDEERVLDERYNARTNAKKLAELMNSL